MSKYEPEITTTVEDGHVYANIAFSGEQFDAIARELNERMDAAVFAQLAMRNGYVPSSMIADVQERNQELRALVDDLWHELLSDETDDETLMDLAVRVRKMRGEKPLTDS